MAINDVAGERVYSSWIYGL